jgi:hypothetical protein
LTCGYRGSTIWIVVGASLILAGGNVPGVIPLATATISSDIHRPQ